MRRTIGFCICILAMVAFGNIAKAGLNEGLVAYYPFDGNATDMSGNGHNGIVSGATLCADRNGKANSAYSFNGVNDYIKIPHHSALNIIGNFSFSFWSNSDNLPYTERVFLAKGRDIFNNYFFGYDGPSGIYLKSGYQNLAAKLGYSIPYDEWHFITVVVDSVNSELRRYQDGEWKKTVELLPYTTTNTYPLVIGRHFTNPDGSGGFEYPWPGDADELRLYNRVLSDEEIAELYNLGNPEVVISLELNNFVQDQHLTSQDDSNLYKFTLTDGTTVALLSTGSLDLKGELFEMIDGEMVPLDVNNDGVTDEGDRQISSEFEDATGTKHLNFMLRPGVDTLNTDEVTYSRILPAGEYFLKVTLDEGVEDFSQPFGILLLKKTETTKVNDFFDGLGALVTDGDMFNDYLDIYVQAVFPWIYDNVGNWHNCVEFGVPAERQCKALPNFYVKYIFGHDGFLHIDCQIDNKITVNHPNFVIRGEGTTIYNASVSPVFENETMSPTKGDIWIQQTGCLVCKSNKYISGYNHYGLQFSETQIIDANSGGRGVLRIANNADQVRTKIVRPE